MAYTDFTITTFGEAWIAQAVSDAQNGTNKAILTSVRYAYIDSEDNWTLWKSDSNPLVNNFGNSFSIRSHVDNSGDTASHFFNTIEIMGRTDGQYGPLGTIASCKSDTTETIPAFDTEPVTKISTVQFAVGADAEITLSASAIPGTLMQDEAVLAWPQTNSEAEITTLHASEIEPPTGTQLITAGDAWVQGDLAVSGAFLAPNIPLHVLIKETGGNYTAYTDGVLMAGPSSSKSDVYAAAVDTSEFTGIVYGTIYDTDDSTTKPEFAFFNNWGDAKTDGSTTSKTFVALVFP